MGGTGKDDAGAPYFIGEEIGSRPGEVLSDLETAGPGLWGARLPGTPAPSVGHHHVQAPALQAESRRCLCRPPQLERARFEAGEALSAMRRLQRRVSELEEESRLQDADVSGASLQSELAHSLDSDQDKDQDTSVCGDTQVSS